MTTSLASGTPTVDDRERCLTIAGTRAQVWIIELASSPARLRAAQAVLNETELARCASVIDPARRERLILARAALREILARKLGVDSQRIEIARSPDGRPVLAGQSELSFSLSHTHGWAAVAVGCHARIGVDIESSGRRIAPGLLRRVLTQAEAASVTALASDQQGEAFLAHWTAKEACAKALGGGLAANLHSLELRDALTHPGLTAPGLVSLKLRALELPHCLVGALAACAR